MTEPPRFDRPRDALYLDLPLRHVIESPVLGVPTRFESNSAAALARLEAWFGSWRALATSPHLIASRGVRVRLVVHEGDEGDRGAPLVWRIPDADRVLVHTPGSLGIAELSRREAVVYVTPELLRDPPHRLHAMVHGLTLPLVNTCDRHPVHAALIAREGTALLLAAPAGTGKSTLAYAAHRAGLRVLSDDAAYVQMEPELQVWGLSGPLHLPPDAAGRFAELRDRAPTLLANGDRKLIVDLPGQWPALGPVPIATRCGACLLERTGGPGSCQPASPADVQVFLLEGVGASRVLHGTALERAIAGIAAGGGWRLALTADPADSVPYLERMLAELERHGPK
ncbi:MAG: hypothetical protein ACRENJ_07085 [Candidatus Eiseniibacteriota bacterium]